MSPAISKTSFSSLSGWKLPFASVLDRREEHAERRREHIAELNKRAAESELRLKRLYDAIESGVADLDDPALKDHRIDGLKAIRDQAKADADRAQAMLQNTGQKAVTPQMLRKFAATARERIRLEGGGYRRDHLRALAQRVEVAEGEVRIMGSKSRLLQTLVAGSGANSVPTQGLKWRRERDCRLTFSGPAIVAPLASQWLRPTAAKRAMTARTGTRGWGSASQQSISVAPIGNFSDLLEHAADAVSRRISAPEPLLRPFDPLLHAPTIDHGRRRGVHRPQNNQKIPDDGQIVPVLGQLSEASPAIGVSFASSLLFIAALFGKLALALRSLSILALLNEQ